MLGRKTSAFPSSAGYELDPELLDLIPEAIALRYQCIPLSLQENVLTLGLVDPNHGIAVDDIQLITGYEVKPVQLRGNFSELAQLAGWQASPAYDCVLAMSKMAVKAQVVGPVAQVKVEQTFENPTEDYLEVVYIFPLSPRAALHQFRMRVGERVIEGQIQEKLEARRTYAQARRAGHRAALLEQQRDNVFTVTIGNIPPGEALHLELAYAERLEMDEAQTIFRFPLTLAPRYLPGEPLEVSSGPGVAADTTRVPDASHISPSLLPAGLRQPGALSIEVEIDHGGLQLTQLNATQHALNTALDEKRALISLARTDEAMNRDFVLRYRCGADASQLLMSDGEYFLLSLMPPAQAPQEMPARDVVLILDRSGSMQGPKMDSARRAAQGVLRQLRLRDRFALVAFDDQIASFRDGELRPISELAAALAWLDQVEARGGTEILTPMQRLVELSQRDSQRFLCAILVTDGQVGNEPEIYAYLRRQKARVRLFTLGIDSCVNEAFLRQVARIGRGTCELVEPGAPLEFALDRLAREIGCPLSSDLEVVDAGLHPLDLQPSPLPDLYAARPVTVLGRHQGDGALRVRGSGGLEIQVFPQRCHNLALPILWAREKIVSLQDALNLGQPLDAAATRAEITQLGLSYQLVTPYTSFVLVDRDQVVNPGGQCSTHLEPVEAPHLWEMDCTMKDISAQDFGPMDFDDEPLTEQQLLQAVSETPIIRVANLILSQAILDGASSVQILKEERAGRVLFEVEAQWHEVMSPPLPIMDTLVARLKYMAGLELAERRMAQSGRIELTHDGDPWDVTVTTIPMGRRESVLLGLAAHLPAPLSTILAGEGAPERLEAVLASARGILHLKSTRSQGWKLFAGLLRKASTARPVALWTSQLTATIPGVGLLLEGAAVKVVGFCEVCPNHWELVAQYAQEHLVIVLHPEALPLEADLGQLYWDQGWQLIDPV
jgi:Ca-activated chloride channel family protein